MRLKIFVIDDAKFSRLMLLDSIKGLDAEIFEFSEAQLAIDEAQKTGQPNLVLLDYYMKTMNADRYLIKLSEEILLHKTCIFLISSKEWSEEDKFKLSSIGVYKFFTKPFKKGELLEAIKEVEEDLTYGINSKQNVSGGL